MRIVLDTNALISSLITKGKTAKLLQRLLEQKVELVISKAILDEFVEVIARRKFLEYVGSKEVKDFLKLLLGVAVLVDVKSRFDITTDKTDNAILATAYDAQADYIVSGDRHLLKLDRFKGIKIVNPRQMIDIISKKFS